EAVSPPLTRETETEMRCDVRAFSPAGKEFKNTSGAYSPSNLEKETRKYILRKAK
ncbi:hypothetical protein M9458_031221, partial [Cirrhinus mrigala]